jgi:hypothetical protein
MNSNDDEKMYKKKYLKYKMKYLSLQRGGLLKGIKTWLNLNKLTSEEQKDICKTDKYVFKECDSFKLSKIKMSSDMTKEQRVAKINEIKGNLLNSRDINSTSTSTDVGNIERAIIFNKTSYIYRGLLKDGLPNGKGYYIDNKGTIYEGTFINGKLNGASKVTDYSKKLVYEGKFIDGKPETNFPKFIELII